MDQINIKLNSSIELIEKQGNPIPRRIQDIPTFPYGDYEELKRSINSGEIIIQRFSNQYISAVFYLFASRFEKILLNVYTVVLPFLLLLPLGLVFLFSYYWLFLFIAFPICLRKIKVLYNSVVFRGSFHSELAFCFLFFLGQVCLTTNDYMRCYYWTRDNTS